MRFDQWSRWAENPSNSAAALGLYRFIFFSGFFWFFAQSDFFLWWSEVPKEMWFSQGLTGPLRPLFFLFDHQNMIWVWRVALLSAAVGLFTRTAMGVSFVLSFFYIGYAQSFGYFTRLYMPILWALLFLSCSRAGDGFSLDAWFKQRRGRADAPSAPAEYAWPFLAVQVVFCGIFFQAGLSKLINGGLQWMGGESIQNRMIQAFIWPFNPDDRVWLGVNRLFFSNLLLCQISAVGTALIEILCPLALFSRRWRAPIVLGMLAMQIVARYTIFVNFSPYLIVYASWLPFDRLSSSKAKKRTSSS